MRSLLISCTGLARNVPASRALRLPRNDQPAPERGLPGRCPASRGAPRGSIFLDDLRLRLDDLLAAIVTVGGHVVAQMRLARSRVGRQLLGRQRVVRTALAAAGGGDSGFLHCHWNDSGKKRKTFSCLASS